MTACRGFRDLSGRLLGLCLTCARLGLPGRAEPAQATNPGGVWQCVNWMPLR